MALLCREGEEVDFIVGVDNGGVPVLFNGAICYSAERIVGAFGFCPAVRLQCIWFLSGGLVLFYRQAHAGTFSRRTYELMRYVCIAATYVRVQSVGTCALQQLMRYEFSP